MTGEALKVGAYGGGRVGREVWEGGEEGGVGSHLLLLGGSMSGMDKWERDWCLEDEEEK